MDFGNNDDIFKFLMSRSGKNNGFGNAAINAYGNTAATMGNSAMKIPVSQNMQNASKSGKGWGGFMGATSGMQGGGGYVSSNNSIDDQTQQQMNGVTSSLNSIPIVGQFKAIGDMAEGIGGAIGGESGSNIVQGFTNPFGRQLEVFKNKNYNAGQKAIAALFPFASGFLKPKAIIDNPEEDRMNKLRDYQLNKIKENNFLKSSDFYKGMLN